MTIFSTEAWHAEISTMGFQSLIYDATGRLVASVEPMAFDGKQPDHGQICRLIAKAPQMYDMLESTVRHLEDSLPQSAQVIRDFLASIDADPAFELRAGARH